ncbi:hypothetical protein CL654_01600 [bacterium]|nr:hypothetical protein [bacterium]
MKIFDIKPSNLLVLWIALFIINIVLVFQSGILSAKIEWYVYLIAPLYVLLILYSVIYIIYHILRNRKK